MNLIDSAEKEKQLLYSISAAKNRAGKEFLRNSTTSEDSYYKIVSCGPEEYMEEYSFDSIIELKNKLMRFWQDEDFMYDFVPCVLASVFKNRPVTSAGNSKSPSAESVDKKREEVLPTYIYTI
jgi:hypothetical protein